MKIAVGSLNAAKLAAVKQGVAAYWPDAEVVGHDVPSGVPGQPVGLEETALGALNRAKNARVQAGSDLGAGLEGGVMELAERMVLFGVVAVWDGVRASVVPSVGVPLPDTWAEAVRNGQELGPFMAERYKEYGRHLGAMPFVTKGQIVRDEAFAYAAKGAFAPWGNAEVFEVEAKIAERVA